MPKKSFTGSRTTLSEGNNEPLGIKLFHTEKERKRKDSIILKQYLKLGWETKLLDDSCILKQKNDKLEYFFKFLRLENCPIAH